MDVKLLAGQPFLDKLKKGVLGGYELINPERYHPFRDVFGKDNFGFVLAGDVQREIRGGEKAPVYGFDEALYPYQAGEGIDSKIFLTSAFSVSGEGFPARENVEEIMNYLESSKDAGKIENIVNSKRSVLFEDKISVLDLQNYGVKTPRSYHFNDFSELENLVNETDEDYIVKHRYGQEGLQLKVVNSENIDLVKDWNMSDYIVQERLKTTDEKRLIFFGDKFLGGRIIFDRSSPWERGTGCGRMSITEPYVPTDKEVKDSLEVLKYSDTLVGCVDWVETEDKGQFYMELNGFGTGYGRGVKPYNLNREVAENLKKRFMNK